MIKMILLTPGPTPIPQSVLDAMAQPARPHRSAEFEAMYAATAASLGRVFRTAGPVLTIAGSGSAAVEAAIWSLAKPGGTIVSCANGKFGERWQTVADRVSSATGGRAVQVSAPWGEPISAEALAAALQQTTDVSVVVFVHCETSTATLSDAKLLASVVREYAPGAMVIADAITTVGAVEVEPDLWGLDAVVGASQKAFGLPPGLGFISVSQRAQDRLRENAGASTPMYFDLREYLRAHDAGATPFTPAISLHCGLAESLRLIEEEGVEARWRRGARLAHVARTAFTAMGLTLASGAPCDSVTAVFVPDGLADPLRDWCCAEREVIFAGGQGGWKGRVVRMSHMGFIGVGETLAGIDALAGGLERLAPSRWSTALGVRSAHEALAKELAG